MPKTYDFPTRETLGPPPKRGYLVDVEEVCRMFGMDPKAKKDRDWVMGNVRPRIELGPRTIRWDINTVHAFIDAKQTA